MSDLTPIEAVFPEDSEGWDFCTMLERLGQPHEVVLGPDARQCILVAGAAFWFDCEGDLLSVAPSPVIAGMDPGRPEGDLTAITLHERSFVDGTWYEAGQYTDPATVKRLVAWANRMLRG